MDNEESYRERFEKLQRHEDKLRIIEREQFRKLQEIRDREKEILLEKQHIFKISFGGQWGGGLGFAERKRDVCRLPSPNSSFSRGFRVKPSPEITSVDKRSLQYSRRGFHSSQT